MHRAILGRADRNREILARRRLRLIRSSSASLRPPDGELEQAFQAPRDRIVRMTEASHQDGLESTAAARAQARFGGLAAGPEIASWTTREGSCRKGEAERSCARPTYPRLREQSGGQRQGVHQRLVRTGDQGSLDGEDYLRISGRLKEMINRGGEKVSPLEWTSS